MENGEGLAQLGVVPPALLPVWETQDLEDTARGAGGFGSTGTAAMREETT